MRGRRSVLHKHRSLQIAAQHGAKRLMNTFPAWKTWLLAATAFLLGAVVSILWAVSLYIQDVQVKAALEIHNSLAWIQAIEQEKHNSVVRVLKTRINCNRSAILDNHNSIFGSDAPLIQKALHDSKEYKDVCFSE